MKQNYTAILYRASTGPEQGFACVLFPHKENPVFITGFPGDETGFSQWEKVLICSVFIDRFDIYIATFCSE